MKLLNHYDGVNPVVNFAIINPAGGQNSATGIDKNKKIWYKWGKFVTLTKE